MADKVHLVKSSPLQQKLTSAVERVIIKAAIECIEVLAEITTEDLTKMLSNRNKN